MDPKILQNIVQSAVAAALQARSIELDYKFNEFAKLVSDSKCKKESSLAIFEDAIINRDIICNESLEAVTCIPEFSGDDNKDNYALWRKAAHKAYEVFKCFEGSSRHYQAVAIIRNKVRGAADQSLTNFGTAFNFKAIITRLDRTYADKSPIPLLEQELSALRQGNLSILQYYDEVEKHLTLLINKCEIGYGYSEAIEFIEEYRKDALQVFILGLKGSLSDALFSSQPADLPAALALSKELIRNQESFLLTSSCNKHMEKDGEALENDIRVAIDNHKFELNSFDEKANFTVVKDSKIKLWVRTEFKEHNSEVFDDASKDNSVGLLPMQTVMAVECLSIPAINSKDSFSCTIDITQKSSEHSVNSLINFGGIRRQNTNFHDNEFIFNPLLELAGKTTTKCIICKKQKYKRHSLKQNKSRSTIDRLINIRNILVNIKSVEKKYKLVAERKVDNLCTDSDRKENKRFTVVKDAENLANFRSEIKKHSFKVFDPGKDYLGSAFRCKWQISWSYQLMINIIK